MEPGDNAAAVQLGRALRRLRKPIPQTVLANRLKSTGKATWADVDQARISRYERGTNMLKLELIPDVEDALGIPRGALLIAAGFVEVVGDIPQAVFADPNPELSGVHREMILKIYPGKSGG